jgi:hypothetical protein
MWEEQRRKYWRYEVFGKRVRRQVKRIPNPVFVPFIPLPPIVIGVRELQELYNGNRWIVPLNIVFDPNRP